MAHYRATVAYDGTRYKGFQIQTDCLTIQGEIERVLRQVTQQSVRIAGSGRTDTGVHAQGQVISFGCDWRHGTAVLERALCALLPRDIAMHDLAETTPDFHARFSAVRRTYVYHAFVGAHREPLLERYALRLPATPRLDAMQEACASLIGERDFAAMGQSPSGGSTVRCVSEARWHVNPPDSSNLFCNGQGEHLWFVIRANGFLRGMVRRIVGSQLQVGTGRMTPAEFERLIDERDISAAAPRAAACGLVLWQVEYDQVSDSGS